MVCVIFLSTVWIITELHFLKCKIFPMRVLDAHCPGSPPMSSLRSDKWQLMTTCNLRTDITYWYKFYPGAYKRTQLPFFFSFFFVFSLLTSLVVNAFSLCSDFHLKGIASWKEGVWLRHNCRHPLKNFRRLNWMKSLCTQEVHKSLLCVFTTCMITSNNVLEIRKDKILSQNSHIIFKY